MMRTVVVGLMVTALLAGAPGAGIANGLSPGMPALPASPWIPVAPEKVMEVTGRLVYDLDHSPVHFEVNDYVLFGVDPAVLLPLVGKMVVVRGTLQSGMSIFMRPVLVVKEIALEEKVSLPAEPPQRIFFGRLTPSCTGVGVHLVEWDGTEIHLEGEGFDHLYGQPVALSAEVEVRQDNTQVYHVREMIPLGSDLAPYLGVIYVQPERRVGVTLAGTSVLMSQPPIMANGRTLVELRSIAEAMGVPITWDGTNQQVTLSRGDRQVVLTIGNPKVLIRHGETATTAFVTDISPVLVNGRTMVPIRVLADGLGLKVVWDAIAWAVHLQ